MLSFSPAWLPCVKNPVFFKQSEAVRREPLVALRNSRHIEWRLLS